MVPDRRAALLIESAHLFLQYPKTLAQAMNQYQEAYKIGRELGASGAAAMYAGKQGGAMVLAIQAKCDRRIQFYPGGTETKQCLEALKLFEEVPAKARTAATWMMMGFVLRYASMQPVEAVEAAEQAIALYPGYESWWTKLSNWCREAQRIQPGGFASDKARLLVDSSRRARDRARSLRPDVASADALWLERLEVELGVKTLKPTNLCIIHDGPVVAALDSTPGGANKATSSTADSASGVGSAFPTVGLQQRVPCDIVDAAAVASSSTSGTIMTHFKARTPVVIRNAVGAHSPSTRTYSIVLAWRWARS